MNNQMYEWDSDTCRFRPLHDRYYIKVDHIGSAEAPLGYDGGKHKRNLNLICKDNDNQEQRSAIGVINHLIKSGQLKRPDQCSQCLKTCKPHAHHHDYSKPRQVVWLCHRCHMDEHKNLRLLEKKRNHNQPEHNAAEQGNGEVLF